MIPFTGNEKESHSGRKQIVPAGGGGVGGAQVGQGKVDTKGLETRNVVPLEQNCTLAD